MAAYSNFRTAVYIQYTHLYCTLHRNLTISGSKVESIGAAVSNSVIDGIQRRCPLKCAAYTVK